MEGNTSPENDGFQGTSKLLSPLEASQLLTDEYSAKILLATYKRKISALDEPDLLEDADLAVAGGNRDAVPLADFLGTDFPLVRSEKDLGTVFVGQQLGGLEGR